MDHCLQDALLIGDLHQVDSCLTRGADPNVRDAFGGTALHLAVRHKAPELLRKLLKAGAEADARREDLYFSTPLMETALTDARDCAELLLDAGASWALRDSFDDQALHWAVYYQRTQLAQLLVANGADLAAESRQGTVLDIALRNHDKRTLEWLRELRGGLSGKGVYGEDPLGIPAICRAAAAGDIEAIDALLPQVRLRTELDPVGQSALAYAAANGRGEVVDYLLMLGCSPNWGDPEEGLYPLALAVRGRSTGIVRSLLAAHAKVNEPLRFTGYTPLMLAVRLGEVEIAGMLLESGADIQARGLDGSTVSDMLAYSPNPEMERLLQSYLLE